MLTYTTHEKIKLRKHPDFNEAWLHDRICDDTSILGLGDVRVLDRERSFANAGRLDILLLDDDNNRRFEVEVMLGATDPSHIIRTIEYWDIERRRYPGYDHVAVLIAEEVTTRFLNVMSLMSGTIPLVAIQLDALKVGNQIVLNFVQVLDQSELRIDDIEESSGGGQVDRKFWDQKVGKDRMSMCDDVLAIINESSQTPQELNYLRGYIGLRSNGVVKNYVYIAPTKTRKFSHIGFRNDNAKEWNERFEEAGVTSVSRRKSRFKITVTPQEFKEHRDLIKEAIDETIKEHGA